eukprot:scaffold2847_cov56-Attheya_sp.AAC.3
MAGWLAAAAYSMITYHRSLILLSAVFVSILIVFGLSCTLAFRFMFHTNNRNVPEIKSRGTATHIQSASMIQAYEKPYLLYGTAWKEERTAELVANAVRAGFRFIDTACQPKHYNEALVGDGWFQAAQELGLSREDFYLQTKFTAAKGQDPNRMPYEEDAELSLQVQQSLAVSLSHLKTEYLDCLVLHSPMRTHEETMQVWQTMETFVDEGRVKTLGLSNCYSLEKFTLIYDQARVKPSILQNRFHAKTNFDTDIRTFCKEMNILYQSFWTLTANRKALASPQIKDMAKKKHATPQTLMYAFLMSLGHTPLSGTTNIEHMKEDITMMKRILDGETMFTPDELHSFAKLLGMPNL